MLTELEKQPSEKIAEILKIIAPLSLLVLKDVKNLSPVATMLAFDRWEIELLIILKLIAYNKTGKITLTEKGNEVLQLYETK